MYRRLFEGSEANLILARKMNNMSLGKSKFLRDKKTKQSGGVKGSSSRTMRVQRTAASPNWLYGNE